MLFRSKLSVFLSVLSLASGITVSEALVCPAPVYAQSSSFGQQGQNGFDGRSGRAGRSSSDRTITVNGAPQIVDLTGESGTDGEDGENGRAAYCGNQPYGVNRNLQAPSGGRGGNGGSGGNGGNGGNLTVYYANPTDLRQLLVNAVGGSGGRGARPGYGGYGCTCAQRQWENRTCTGTPGTADYRCTSQWYTCTDGANGATGNLGRDGAPGQTGTLTLINQVQPLPPETPTYTAPISDLLNRDIPLSKNLWRLGRGAATLLAPGSVVADQYREYAGRAEGTVQVIWQSPRSPNEFAGSQGTVAIQDDRQIAVSFGEDVWADGTATQQSGRTIYTVANVIRRQEATQLSVTGLTGSRNAMQLIVLDQANRSDLVSTQFRVRYRSTDGIPSDRRPDLRTRYEGELPTELVSRDANRFTLALGRLPLNGRFIGPGTAVEVQVVAVRSFGGRSAEQTLTWRGELRR